MYNNFPWNQQWSGQANGGGFSMQGQQAQGQTGLRPGVMNAQQITNQQPIQLQFQQLQQQQQQQLLQGSPNMLGLLNQQQAFLQQQQLLQQQQQPNRFLSQQQQQQNYNQQQNFSSQSQQRHNFPQQGNFNQQDSQQGSFRQQQPSQQNYPRGSNNSAQEKFQQQQSNFQNFNQDSFNQQSMRFQQAQQQQGFQPNSFSSWGQGGQNQGQPPLPPGPPPSDQESKNGPQGPQPPRPPLNATQYNQAPPPPPPPPPPPKEPPKPVPPPVSAPLNSFMSAASIEDTVNKILPFITDIFNKSGENILTGGIPGLDVAPDKPEELKEAKKPTSWKSLKGQKREEIVLSDSSDKSRESPKTEYSGSSQKGPSDVTKSEQNAVKPDLQSGTKAIPPAPPKIAAKDSELSIVKDSSNSNGKKTELVTKELKPSNEPKKTADLVAKAPQEAVKTEPTKVSPAKSAPINASAVQSSSSDAKTTVPIAPSVTPATVNSNIKEESGVMQKPVGAATESTKPEALLQKISEMKPGGETPSSSEDKQQPAPHSAAAASNQKYDLKTLQDFDKKFEDWEKQFDNWKIANRGHKDKQAYNRYVEQWSHWRQQLVDQRKFILDQMEKQKKAEEEERRREEEEKRRQQEEKKRLEEEEKQRLINLAKAAEFLTKSGDFITAVPKVLESPSLSSTDSTPSSLKPPVSVDTSKPFSDLFSPTTASGSTQAGGKNPFEMFGNPFGQNPFAQGNPFDANPFTTASNPFVQIPRLSGPAQGGLGPKDPTVPKPLMSIPLADGRVARNRQFDDAEPQPKQRRNEWNSFDERSGDRKTDRFGIKDAPPVPNRKDPNPFELAASQNPFNVSSSFPPTNSNPWNTSSGFGNSWNSDPVKPKIGNVWNSEPAKLNSGSSFEPTPLPTFSKFLQEQEKTNSSAYTRISRTRNENYRSLENEDEYDPPPKLVADDDDFGSMYRRPKVRSFAPDGEDEGHSAVIDYGHGASRDVPEDEDDMLKFVRRETAEFKSTESALVDDDEEEDRLKDCVTIDYGHGAGVTIVDPGFGITPDDIPPHPREYYDRPIDYDDGLPRRFEDSAPAPFYRGAGPPPEDEGYQRAERLAPPREIIPEPPSNVIIRGGRSYRTAPRGPSPPPRVRLAPALSPSQQEGSRSRESKDISPAGTRGGSLSTERGPKVAQPPREEERRGRDRSRGRENRGRDRSRERNRSRGRDRSKGRDRSRERNRSGDRSRVQERSHGRDRGRERDRESDKNREKNNSKTGDTLKGKQHTEKDTEVVSSDEVEIILEKDNKGNDKDNNKEIDREKERDRQRERERERERERSKLRDRDKESEWKHGRGRDNGRKPEALDHLDRWGRNSGRRLDQSRSTSPELDLLVNPPPPVIPTPGVIGPPRPPLSQPTEDSSRVQIVLVEDILSVTGRKRRPAQIAVIMRGLPGSGKSYVAKLMKDREVEMGGSAPRVLSLDDYFMTEEKERVTKDPVTGKEVKEKVMEYEYDALAEPSYRLDLIKTFKKTVENGYFPFIIVDAVNDKLKYFEDMASYATSKRFQVYIAEMENNAEDCIKKNIHGRRRDEIIGLDRGWEKLPNSYVRLDVRQLLQDEAVQDVEMEDVSPFGVEIEAAVSNVKSVAAQEIDTGDVEEEKLVPGLATSKWESMDHSEEKLNKLDGLKRKRKSSGDEDEAIKSMESWLTRNLPEDYSVRRGSGAGQKRVRWADIEERREQERMRDIGFVVGQTDWNRMTDPTFGSAALTKTKFI